MSAKPITSKTAHALRVLGHHEGIALSGASLARSLWPNELKTCHSSARKSGYYRVAGSIGFRLLKLKYVKWGFSRDGGHEGWLITDQGKAALADFDSSLPACNR